MVLFTINDKLITSISLSTIIPHSIPVNPTQRNINPIRFIDLVLLPLSSWLLWLRWKLLTVLNEIEIFEIIAARGGGMGGLGALKGWFGADFKRKLRYMDSGLWYVGLRRSKRIWFFWPAAASKMGTSASAREQQYYIEDRSDIRGRRRGAFAGFVVNSWNYRKIANAKFLGNVKMQKCRFPLSQSSSCV